MQKRQQKMLGKSIWLFLFLSLGTIALALCGYYIWASYEKISEAVPQIKDAVNNITSGNYQNSKSDAINDIINDLKPAWDSIIAMCITFVLYVIFSIISGLKSSSLHAQCQIYSEINKEYYRGAKILSKLIRFFLFFLVTIVFSWFLNIFLIIKLAKARKIKVLNSLENTEKNKNESNNKQNKDLRYIKVIQLV